MINVSVLSADMQALREKAPLVMNITNFVAMDFTANSLLAIGASPLMAHAKEEIIELTHKANALVLNMGTLDNVWSESMLLAGKTMNRQGGVVVFDPVGAGASEYRTRVAQQLIQETNPTIIRGNFSEIAALVGKPFMGKGVDSMPASVYAIDVAKTLALQTKSVVVMSGETDYITNGEEVNCVHNGHEWQTKITAMGCTTTTICAAFAAVNTNAMTAAVHAMTMVGVAAEKAAVISQGPGSMRMHFIDTLFNISAQEIYTQARV